MIMHDHVHFFCGQGVHEPEPIKCWLKYWKHLASAELPELEGAWQADGWDTQMRTAGQYISKLEYVAQNPVRRGLVTKSAEWPYQGRVNELIWING